MSLPIDVAFLAEGDVLEHAAFVGRLNSEVALRFIRAATETYQYLAEFPGSGTFYEIEDPSIPALRKWPVKGFPNYLVFSRNEGTKLEIVRVLHGARDLAAILRRMLGEP